MDLKTFINLTKIFEEVMDDGEIEDLRRFLLNNETTLSPTVVLRIILTLNRAIPLVSDPELQKDMKQIKEHLRGRLVEIVE